MAAESQLQVVIYQRPVANCITYGERRSCALKTVNVTHPKDLKGLSRPDYTAAPMG